MLDESIKFMSHATSPLQTPLWLPQSLWLAGLVLFAVVALLLALHAGLLMLRDRAALNRLYGPPSLDEEIATEVGALLERQGSKP